MKEEEKFPTQCYVDESIHVKEGFTVTAFVFSRASFRAEIVSALRESGLVPGKDEFHSSSRMDSSESMRRARRNLLYLTNTKARVAVYVGEANKKALGKNCLQALQSTMVRNGIRPSMFNVYFDRDIFASKQEAIRLKGLFPFLKPCRFFPQEDSRKRLGIQVADAVAGSFGQIIKESLTRNEKMVDIGGPNTGYAQGTMVPLGWELLMTLRYSIFTRPMVYKGEDYDPAVDPVVLDPQYDDPATYGQNPVVHGWGVQVAPEAPDRLHICVAKSLGKIWLGCIH